MRSKERRRFWGLNTFQGKAKMVLFKYQTLTKSYIINNLVRFNRTLNKKHRINAVAGVSRIQEMQIQKYLQFKIL